MENLGASQLAALCRACLVPSEHKKCLLNEDEETANLINRFLAVACLEVIIINAKFPCFLCKNCEEKTNQAYEFQEICKQSDEIIKKILGIKAPNNDSWNTDASFEAIRCGYFEDTCQEDKTSKNETCNSEASFETKEFDDFHENSQNHEVIHNTCATCEICYKVFSTEGFLKKHMLTHQQKGSKDQKPFEKVKNISNSDIEISQDEWECVNLEKQCSSKKETSNKKKNISGVKLKQFPKEEVDLIIATVKKRMEGLRGCRYCEFVAANPRSLCHHMNMFHKLQRNSWCWICNLENVENIDEHNKKIHDKDLECPFCKRISKNNTQFIEHLSRHSAQGSYRCKPCDISFVRIDLLEKHNSELHPDDLVTSSRLKKQMRLEKMLSTGLSRGSRVQQYSKEQVEAEIKKVQARMEARADCPLCPFSALNTKTLSTHIFARHKKEKDKWCFFCNKADIEHLKDHKLKMHSDEYVCPFCSKKQCNVTIYIEHLLRHSEVKNVECTLCGKRFINEKYLEKHKKLHDEVNSLVEEKNYSSDDDRNLSEYIADKVNRSQDENSKALRNEQYIKVEMEENETNSTLKKNLPTSPANNFCKLCQRMVQNLGRHVRKWHSDQPEPKQLCQQCGKTFSTRDNLNSHLKIHRGIRPYKCQFCPRSFFTNSHMKSHTRMHTKEKPYVCQICGKAFGQSSMLHTHMRLHTGRPHQCNICEKRFCIPAQLRIHMRKHTGEKPYVCDQCGRGFVQKSHLVDHRMTHFDERPYHCAYCERAFTKITSMRNHELTHTGAKPFKCSICPFTCIKSYNLTKHMMTHEGDRPMMNKPYVCEICTKRFQTKAHLYSHFDRYHQSCQDILVEDKMTDTNSG